MYTGKDWENMHRQDLADIYQPHTNHHPHNWTYIDCKNWAIIHLVGLI